MKKSEEFAKILKKAIDLRIKFIIIIVETFLEHFYMAGKQLYGSAFIACEEGKVTQYYLCEKLTHFNIEEIQ